MKYYDKNKYLNQTETIKYLGITYTKLELLMYDDLDVIEFGRSKLFKKEQLDELIKRKFSFERSSRLLKLKKETCDKESLNMPISKESNVSITISREDLMMFGQYLIAEAKKEFECSLKAKNEEKYLTKKEVAEILHVDVSTLWNWDKKNYLKPIEVGGRRLYKKSDISKLLKK